MNLEEKLAAQPFPKVSRAGIEARIVGTDYQILANSTVTICNIRLENGFSVRGESACVDARNFDRQTGEELAYKNGFNKLWELEGYLLAEHQWASGR